MSMEEYREQKERLLREADKLHERFLLSQTVGPDYFEPGMMEYLDQSEGIYNPEDDTLLLRFEAKGTRYDGRTEEIERVRAGDRLTILRDKENPYNANNFTIVTQKNRNVGHMPAELCNAIAPLYDSGYVRFEYTKASFVDPISKRSRYAKQGMLFVETVLRFQQ